MAYYVSAVLYMLCLCVQVLYVVCISICFSSPILGMKSFNIFLFTINLNFHLALLRNYLISPKHGIIKLLYVIKILHSLLKYIYT